MEEEVILRVQQEELVPPCPTCGRRMVERAYTRYDGHGVRVGWELRFEGFIRTCGLLHDSCNSTPDEEVKC